MFPHLSFEAHQVNMGASYQVQTRAMDSFIHSFKGVSDREQKMLLLRGTLRDTGGQIEPTNGVIITVPVRPGGHQRFIKEFRMIQR